MTLNEFRVWLEGFEASFTDGAPNVEQWKTIRAKLAGAYVPQNGFIPQWNPLFGGPPVQRYVAPSADYVDPNPARAIS